MKTRLPNCHGSWLTQGSSFAQAQIDLSAVQVWPGMAATDLAGSAWSSAFRNSLVSQADMDQHRCRVEHFGECLKRNFKLI